MPPISCTKSNTWSAHKDSPLSKTVLSSFLRTKSLHHRSRLRKRYFGWHQPPERPALCLPSIVQSQTPDQCIKTVHYPKQFYPFWGGQVFASQFKTKKEMFWVTPIPWRISFMFPISCTKSNTSSALRGSPLSKTVLSSFLRSKSLHHRSRLRKRFFGWHQPLEWPALCLPSFVQSQTPHQHLKTVQYPKQFYPVYFLGLFLGLNNTVFYFV